MKLLLHMFRNENIGTEVMKFDLVTECEGGRGEKKTTVSR